MNGDEGWTNEQVQAYAEEHWPLIRDHAEDCPCDLCWEWVVITQK